MRTHKRPSSRLGAMLKSLRTGAGLSVTHAAARAGISPGYISTLEAGQRKMPSGKVLEGLARAYDADLSQLLTAAGRSARLPLGAPSPEGRVPDREWAKFRLDWAVETVYRDLEFGMPHGVNDGATISPQTVAEKFFVVDTYQRLTGRVLILPSEVGAIRNLLMGARRSARQIIETPAEELTKPFGPTASSKQAASSEQVASSESETPPLGMNHDDANASTERQDDEK